MNEAIKLAIEIKDIDGNPLKVGDTVLVEEAWEDDAGYYHDEYLTISRILPDGQLKFRIGDWRTRKQREQKLQAWINRFEYHGEDCQLVTP